MGAMVRGENRHEASPLLGFFLHLATIPLSCTWHPTHLCDRDLQARLAIALENHGVCVRLDLFKIPNSRRVLHVEG